MDLYAPYANSKADYNEADNRIKNDMHLSTIAQEAAMRGTPLNPAEINEVAWWMPNSYNDRTNISNAPEGSRV
jgi:hypothetical protein